MNNFTTTPKRERVSVIFLIIDWVIPIILFKSKLSDISLFVSIILSTSSEILKLLITFLIRFPCLFTVPDSENSSLTFLIWCSAYVTASVSISLNGPVVEWFVHNLKL